MTSKAIKRYGVQPKTSVEVAHDAGKALKNPASITPKQVQSLAGSVEAHKEPRKTPKGK